MNAVKPAFGAGSLTEAFRLLGADPTPSDEVSLNVPDFVENGATVPVEVSTQLPGVQEIFILSEANPFPLVARFSVPEGTDAFVSVRIKVASSCNIHALVHSEGRFLSAVKATTRTSSWSRLIVTCSSTAAGEIFVNLPGHVAFKSSFSANDEPS